VSGFRKCKFDYEYFNGNPLFRLQCEESVENVVPVHTHPGEFLLLNRQGQIFHNRNGSIKPLVDFGDSVQLAFCNGCVVLVNREGLAFRFVKDTHVPLRELYYSGANNQCHVEIPRQEAQSWAKVAECESSYIAMLSFAQRCR
jgi:hypothetical protein